MRKLSPLLLLTFTLLIPLAAWAAGEPEANPKLHTYTCTVSHHDKNNVVTTFPDSCVAANTSDAFAIFTGRHLGDSIFFIHQCD